MKWIFLIVFYVCGISLVIAQDSLSFTNKPVRILKKINPLIGLGFKSQNILNTNGIGSYINLGLTFNKSLKITYGSENTSASFGFSDVNNSALVLDGFNIRQRNMGITYIYKEHKILHPAFNIKFSNTKIHPYFSKEMIVFRGIKPGIDLQLNINKYFRFNLGLARNIFTKSISYPDIKPLSGNEFSFGLEFSRFKK